MALVTLPNASILKNIFHILHMWKLLLLFTVLLFVVLTFFASDIGEQLKNAWAGLWCPRGSIDDNEPEFDIVDYEPNGTAPPLRQRVPREKCKTRVRAATGTASSVLVCLLVTYVISRFLGLTKRF